MREIFKYGSVGRAPRERCLYPECQMFKYIADTPTVGMIAGIDDIKRFLRPLMFPTLLEIARTPKCSRILCSPLVICTWSLSQIYPWV